MATGKGTQSRGRRLRLTFAGGVHVRLRRWGPVRSGETWTISTWAPQALSVDLLLGGKRVPLSKGADGFWTIQTEAPAGAVYCLRVDDAIIPDPASRLQYGDVHGASVLIDHGTHQWRDNWKGRDWTEAAIYELHLGTFTPQGTFTAAAEKLDDLADLGITAVEIMPVGQFPGTSGWGYDGVLPFAPHPSAAPITSRRRSGPSPIFETFHNFCFRWLMAVSASARARQRSRDLWQVSPLGQVRQMSVARSRPNAGDGHQSPRRPILFRRPRNLVVKFGACRPA